MNISHLESMTAYVRSKCYCPQLICFSFKFAQNCLNTAELYNHLVYGGKKHI